MTINKNRIQAVYYVDENNDIQASFPTLPDTIVGIGATVEMALEALRYSLHDYEIEMGKVYEEAFNKNLHIVEMQFNDR